MIRLWFVGTLLGVPHFARAQSMTEDDPLTFGQIVIADTSSVARVTIAPNGDVSTSANVYLKEQPSRGLYTLYDYPASTAFTITFPASVTLTGPSSNFTLDTLAATPASQSTDASGSASFYISGRLQSAGGGAPYSDGTYTGSFVINLNF